MKGLQILLLSLLAMPTLASTFSDSEIIAMAREGAPDHITSRATIMKFDNGQFREIHKGKNNFTCMVISDPQGRYEPSCFNKEAMRSVFATYQFQMKQLYEGKTHEIVNQEIQDEFNKGRLPTAETGALVYMMSPHNKMFVPSIKKLVRTPVHHMYYYPKLANETFSLSGKSISIWQGYPHLTALIVVVAEAKP